MKLPFLYSPHTLGSGFPRSRPPTDGYDRESYVLVLSESQETLKYVKMHLNRFFSHVVVVKKIHECQTALEEKVFDVLLTDMVDSKKNHVEATKKIGAHYRSMPIVLVSSGEIFENFKYSVIAGIIPPHFPLDHFHGCLRRALELRNLLKELDELLPSRVALGKLVHSEEKGEGRLGILLDDIRIILKNPTPF